MLHINYTNYFTPKKTMTYDAKTLLQNTAYSISHAKFFLIKYRTRFYGTIHL